METSQIAFNIKIERNPYIQPRALVNLASLNRNEIQQSLMTEIAMVNCYQGIALLKSRNNPCRQMTRYQSGWQRTG